MVGVGIGIMYYSGMVVMEFVFLLRYDFGLFVLFIVVVVILVMIFLVIKFGVSKNKNNSCNFLGVLLVFVVMGLVIVGMYYIGMVVVWFVLFSGMELSM